MTKTSKSHSLHWRVVFPIVLFLGIGATVWSTLNLVNLEYQQWVSRLDKYVYQTSENISKQWLNTLRDVQNKEDDTFENIRIAGLLGIEYIDEPISSRWSSSETAVSYFLTNAQNKNIEIKFNVEKFLKSQIKQELLEKTYFDYQLSYGQRVLAEGLWNPYKITNDQLNRVFSREKFDTDIYLGRAKLTVNWRFTPSTFDGVNWGRAVLSVFLGLVVTGFILFLLWLQARGKTIQSQNLLKYVRELELGKSRFHVVSENAYDLITVLRLDGTVDYVNNTVYRILGYTKDEMKGKKFIDFMHIRDKQMLEETMEKVRSDGSGEPITVRLKHKNETWVYIECVCNSVNDKNWALANFVIHGRDISARKKYADNLARSEQRFRDFADSSADWLWEVNDDCYFTYISPGVTKTLGYSPEEVLGKPQLQVLFDKSEDLTRSLVQSRIDRFQPYRDIEFWTKSKLGERVCLRISGVPVFDERHNYLGYRGAASNITTSKLDRENMFRLATTDHLTGLLNRARFNEELDRVLNICLRQKVTGVLMFIDLDQFKSINDTYGHDAGDTLIRAVADVLKNHVRTTDVVARLGGDEFGIIMHDIDLDTAKIKVQAIIDDLNALQVPYQDEVLHCTMSIGMVSYPDEGIDSASLLMRADLAMYRAKDMGRNRLYIASNSGANEDEISPNSENNKEIDAHKDNMREQLRWVDRVKRAIEKGDFEMHYQPLVSSSREAIPHFEALVRMKDDNGNFGSPGIFIEAAEHHGLIKDLDLKVIERCIEQQLEMKEKGYHTSISMNLSGKSLADSDMVDMLKTLIHKFPEMDPKDFTFEVTETAALHDPKAVKQMERLQNFIDSLRELGFKFALDDFGTGFSSFNYIKHLNVDCIKIDGSFILPIENSEQDRLFVKAITDLANGLGISTVAEFVENEEILTIIQELGIKRAQGYHLSKPEPNLEKLCKQFRDKGMDDFKKKSKAKS